jgi:hypothetical protein
MVVAVLTFEKPRWLQEKGSALRGMSAAWTQRRWSGEVAFCFERNRTELV